MKAQRDQWVEGVLASADGITRVKAPAGFYEKTRARITATELVPPSYILRIAAGVLLLVAFNAFACVSLINYKAQNEDKNLSAFAKEYSITAANDNF